MVVHLNRFNYWGGHMGGGGRMCGFTSSNNININLGGRYPYAGGMFNFDNYMMPPRPRTKAEKFWDGFDRAMNSLAPIGLGVAAFLAIFKKDKAEKPEKDTPISSEEQLKADKERYNELLAKEKNGTITQEEQEELNTLRKNHPDFDLQTQLDAANAARTAAEEARAAAEAAQTKAEAERDAALAEQNDRTAAPADGSGSSVKPAGSGKVNNRRGVTGNGNAQSEKKDKDDYIYLNGQLMLGKTLSPKQKKRLDEIRTKHPDWDFDPTNSNIKIKSTKPKPETTTKTATIQYNLQKNFFGKKVMSGDATLTVNGQTYTITVPDIRMSSTEKAEENLLNAAKAKLKEMGLQNVKIEES